MNDNMCIKLLCMSDNRGMVDNGDMLGMVDNSGNDTASKAIQNVCYSCLCADLDVQCSCEL